MRRFLIPAFLLAALVYSALLFYSAAKESQTFDEGAHIVAGYSYWLKHDYRLNPEHPPLMKLLCSVPLLVLHPPFPADDGAWRTADQFQLAYELLYLSSVDAQQMLVACRTVTILFTALFSLALTAWVWRVVSPRAALIVFLLFVFDPNIAAHGHYVTNDIFVAAFSFFAIAFWYEWLTARQTRFLWLAGTMFGLALAAKYNAVFLVPAFFLMWAAYRWTGNRQAGKPLALCAAAIAVPFVILFALYQGDTRSVAQDPLVMSRLEARHEVPAHWEQIRVPIYYWLRGVQLLFRHQHSGHPTYFLGRVSSSGFLAYFPVAVAVKTATGTLSLCLAGALILLRRRRPNLISQFTLPLALSVPMVLYFCLTLLSKIDIGFRHILLLYPLLYVVLGYLLDKYWNDKLVRVATLAALLINAVEFACVYPNQLAFFNTLAGGPANAPKYILDSNADWGQGLIHLRQFRTQHPGECIALAYWGRADVNYYLPGTSGAPTTLADAKSQPCLVAVSLNSLYADPDQRWSYLHSYKPMARPSYSIYVYDPRRF